jgi:hypothetical protein
MSDRPSFDAYIAKKKADNQTSYEKKIFGTIDKLLGPFFDSSGGRLTTLKELNVSNKMPWRIVPCFRYKGCTLEELMFQMHTIEGLWEPIIETDGSQQSIYVINVIDKAKGISRQDWAVVGTRESGGNIVRAGRRRFIHTTVRGREFLIEPLKQLCEVAKQFWEKEFDG